MRTPVFTAARWSRCSRWPARRMRRRRRADRAARNDRCPRSEVTWQIKQLRDAEVLLPQGAGLLRVRDPLRCADWARLAGSLPTASRPPAGTSVPNWNGNGSLWVLFNQRTTSWRRRIRRRTPGQSSAVTRGDRRTLNRTRVAGSTDQRHAGHRHVPDGRDSSPSRGERFPTEGCCEVTRPTWRASLTSCAVLKTTLAPESPGFRRTPRPTWRARLTTAVGDHPAAGNRQISGLSLDAHCDRARVRGPHLAQPQRRAAAAVAVDRIVGIARRTFRP